MTEHTTSRTLTRELGLIGLAATGICSMMGAAINVIPIAVQRNIPGIGGFVLPAYMLAAVPALFAALAFAILSSAMPRAGGSYIYASRSLHPYLGFVASFSQWFGISIAIGIVSYVLVPFLRDIADAVGWTGLAGLLEEGYVRVPLALAFLWVFVGINILGLKFYERILIPLMVLMFLGGAVVIVAGFLFEQSDFVAAVAARGGEAVATDTEATPTVGKLMATAVVLFATFIGFDSIAQAGGEARDPNRTMPLAIGIAIVTVGSFYLLFTWALYDIVPWQFMAERGADTDLTAPGLLGYLLSTPWTVAIVAGAAIALINDLPAMLLATSRLVFAWAEDGVFPRAIAVVNERYHTPHWAIVFSGIVASASIFGNHLAGDFFAGVDILTTALLVTFLLMCVSVLVLPHRNPALAAEVRFVRNRAGQLIVGGGGAALLSVFLVAHITRDLTTDQPAWYFHSTYTWLVVMAGASGVFALEWRKLRSEGIDTDRLFGELPEA